MAEIVLRVRLIDGDHLDVRYEELGTADADEVTEHVISALASDTGVLRARHGPVTGTCPRRDGTGRRARAGLPKRSPTVTASATPQAPS